jgi:hypothetical protein
MRGNQASPEVPGGAFRTPMNETDTTRFRAVATVHAAYWIVTGVWPVVSIGSFQWVTGRKHDLWLVKTVGLLLVVIGAVIGMAARRGSTSPEIPTLAIGSAATVAAVDILYYRKGVLRWVYPVDAAGEIALIAAWLAAWRRGSQ